MPGTKDPIDPDRVYNFRDFVDLVGPEGDINVHGYTLSILAQLYAAKKNKVPVKEIKSLDKGPEALTEIVRNSIGSCPMREGDPLDDGDLQIHAVEIYVIMTECEQRGISPVAQPCPG